MSDKKELNPRPTSVVMVGAGGVGSHLAPTLVKLLRQFQPNLELIIVDGDVLEPRNLDRQLFSRKDIGKPKAESLAGMIRLSYPKAKAVSEWFTDGFPVDQGSLLLSCVDNHAARRAILLTADMIKGYAILGGNEYTDCEAMFYTHEWEGTPEDPRVYYPSILTDDTDDPLRRLAGCQGEAQIASPQLALSNMGAAYYMLHLFWFWFVEGQTLTPDVYEFCPVRHHNNFTRCGTVKRGELKKPHPQSIKEPTNDNDQSKETKGKEGNEDGGPGPSGGHHPGSTDTGNPTSATSPASTS